MMKIQFSSVVPSSLLLILFILQSVREQTGEVFFVCGYSRKNLVSYLTSPSSFLHTTTTTTSIRSRIVNKKEKVSFGIINPILNNNYNYINTIRGGDDGDYLNSDNNNNDNDNDVDESSSSDDLTTNNIIDEENESISTSSIVEENTSSYISDNDNYDVDINSDNSDNSESEDESEDESEEEVVIIESDLSPRDFIKYKADTLIRNNEQSSLSSSSSSVKMISSSCKKLLRQIALKLPAIQRSPDILLKIRNANSEDATLAAFAVGVLADAFSYAADTTISKITHHNNNDDEEEEGASSSIRKKLLGKSNNNNNNNNNKINLIQPSKFLEMIIGNDRRWEQIVECMLCGIYIDSSSGNNNNNNNEKDHDDVKENVQDNNDEVTKDQQQQDEENNKAVATERGGLDLLDASYAAWGLTCIWQQLSGSLDTDTYDTNHKIKASSTTTTSLLTEIQMGGETLYDILKSISIHSYNKVKQYENDVLLSHHTITQEEENEEKKDNLSSSSSNIESTIAKNVALSMYRLARVKVMTNGLISSFDFFRTSISLLCNPIIEEKGDIDDPSNLQQISSTSTSYEEQDILDRLEKADSSEEKESDSETDLVEVEDPENNNDNIQTEEHEEEHDQQGTIMIEAEESKNNNMTLDTNIEDTSTTIQQGHNIVTKDKEEDSQEIEQEAKDPPSPDVLLKHLSSDELVKTLWSMAVHILDQQDQDTKEEEEEIMMVDSAFRHINTFLRSDLEALKSWLSSSTEEQKQNNNNNNNSVKNFKEKEIEEEEGQMIEQDNNNDNTGEDSTTSATDEDDEHTTNITQNEDYTDEDMLENLVGDDNDDEEDMESGGTEVLEVIDAAALLSGDVNAEREVFSLNTTTTTSKTSTTTSNDEEEINQQDPEDPNNNNTTAVEVIDAATLLESDENIHTIEREVLHVSSESSENEPPVSVTPSSSHSMDDVQSDGDESSPVPVPMSSSSSSEVMEENQELREEKEGEELSDPTPPTTMRQELQSIPSLSFSFKQLCCIIWSLSELVGSISQSYHDPYYQETIHLILNIIATQHQITHNEKDFEALFQNLDPIDMLNLLQGIEKITSNNISFGNDKEEKRDQESIILITTEIVKCYSAIILNHQQKKERDDSDSSNSMLLILTSSNYLSQVMYSLAKIISSLSSLSEYKKSEKDELFKRFLDLSLMAFQVPFRMSTSRKITTTISDDEDDDDGTTNPIDDDYIMSSFSPSSSLQISEDWYNNPEALTKLVCAFSQAVITTTSSDSKFLLGGHDTNKISFVIGQYLSILESILLQWEIYGSDLLQQQVSSSSLSTDHPHETNGEYCSQGNYNMRWLKKSHSIPWMESYYGNSQSKYALYNSSKENSSIKQQHQKRDEEQSSSSNEKDIEDTYNSEENETSKEDALKKHLSSLPLNTSQLYEVVYAFIRLEDEMKKKKNNQSSSSVHTMSTPTKLSNELVRIAAHVFFMEQEANTSSSSLLDISRLSYAFAKSSLSTPSSLSSQGVVKSFISNIVKLIHQEHSCSEDEKKELCNILPPDNIAELLWSLGKFGVRFHPTSSSHHIDINNNNREGEEDANHFPSIMMKRPTITTNHHHQYSLLHNMSLPSKIKMFRAICQLNQGNDKFVLSSTDYHILNTLMASIHKNIDNASPSEICELFSLMTEFRDDLIDICQVYYFKRRRTKKENDKDQQENDKELFAFMIHASHPPTNESYDDSAIPTSDDNDTIIDNSGDQEGEVEVDAISPDQESEETINKSNDSDEILDDDLKEEEHSDTSNLLGEENQNTESDTTDAEEMNDDYDDRAIEEEEAAVDAVIDNLVQGEEKEKRRKIVEANIIWERSYSLLLQSNYFINLLLEEKMLSKSTNSSSSSILPKLSASEIKLILDIVITNVPSFPVALSEDLMSAIEKEVKERISHFKFHHENNDESISQLVQSSRNDLMNAINSFKYGDGREEDLVGTNNITKQNTGVAPFKALWKKMKSEEEKTSANQEEDDDDLEEDIGEESFSTILESVLKNMNTLMTRLEQFELSHPKNNYIDYLEVIMKQEETKVSLELGSCIALIEEYRRLMTKIRQLHLIHEGNQDDHEKKQKSRLHLFWDKLRE